MEGKIMQKGSVPTNHANHTNANSAEDMLNNKDAKALRAFPANVDLAWLSVFASLLFKSPGCMRWMLGLSEKLTHHE